LTKNKKNSPRFWSSRLQLSPKLLTDLLHNRICKQWLYHFVDG
jgi:hypothetical protein